MEEIIYNETWKPSKVDYNWKPEKLARYPYNFGLIDYKSQGCLLGFSQEFEGGEYKVVEDNTKNITDFIPIVSKPNFEANFDFPISITNLSISLSSKFKLNNNKTINQISFLSDSISNLFIQDGYLKDNRGKNYIEVIKIQNNTFLFGETLDSTTTYIVSRNFEKNLTPKGVLDSSDQTIKYTFEIIINEIDESTYEAYENWYRENYPFLLWTYGYPAVIRNSNNTAISAFLKRYQNDNEQYITVLRIGNHYESLEDALNDIEGNTFLNTATTDGNIEFLSTQFDEFSPITPPITIYPSSMRIEAGEMTNLTGINLNFNRIYNFICNQNLQKGVYNIWLYDANKNFIEEISLLEGSDELSGSFEISSKDFCYIRLTLYKEAWEKCILDTDYNISNSDVIKQSSVLNIFNNKTEEKLYQDLHFEVYVKEEALIKNFVEFFKLNSFQNASHLAMHTYTDPKNYGRSINSINECGLIIIDNINENSSNLNQNYVAKLTYKNLWGCDMNNYLQTFAVDSYFCITYNKNFSENLRKFSQFYNKNFDQGYFKNNDLGGVKLFLGDKFNQDEILGQIKLNNYWTTNQEIFHGTPINWNSKTDGVINGCFGGKFDNPFDHYRIFRPSLAMPFFKEKSFDDAYIQLNLQREDRLGNIYKRIVELPVLLTFANNLIKIYYKSYDENIDYKILQKEYDYEYLNSNNEYLYFIDSNGSGDLGIYVNNRYFTIWCPDITKLTISTTFTGKLSKKAVETPEPTCGILLYPKFELKNGQIGIIHWQFRFSPNYKDTFLKAVHVLEYNDGENYDKFTYIETINLY